MEGIMYIYNDKSHITDNFENDNRRAKKLLIPIIIQTYEADFDIDNDLIGSYNNYIHDIPPPHGW